VLLPAGTATVSVLVHGPPGAVEKRPPGELDVSPTWSGPAAVSSTPLNVRSPTVIGAEGSPATSACGELVNASTDGFQVANDAQPWLNHAPSRSPRHQRFCPGGPHAPMPGSAGSTGSPESRSAAARRSRIAPLWLVKSDVGIPERFFGVQAKPARSSAAPALAWRSA
jgi:hypothetical protein